MQTFLEASDPRAEIRWWLLGGALTFVVLMAAGNMALYPLAQIKAIWSVEVVYNVFWFGVLVGQGGVVAIWLGLGRSSALIRVAGAGLIFAALGGACLVGYLLWESFEGKIVSFNDWAELGATILGIPIFIFAAAAPLWLMRLFGWEIRCADSPAAARFQFRQYSIGNLIFLTSLVAVLLGCGQQAAHLSGTDSLEFWALMLMWGLATFILSAATLIPAALLLSRYPLLGLGILTGVTATVYGVAIWYILALVNAFGGSPSSGATWAAIGLAGCPFVGFLFTICLPLVVVRKCGYRLMMGRG